jgi:predicted SnoaL-like aldol condensation-catalyzing enzyme
MKRTLFLAVPCIVVFMFLLAACHNQSMQAEGQKARLDSLTRELTAMKAVNQQLDANKKLVADLYQELFGDKNIDAVDKYIGDNYIQHNPSVADGKEALRDALKKWFKGAPKEKIDIRHIGADGNYVYIHTKSKSGSKTVSVIDIFRVEGNKVVEHWDVMQEVPEKAANSHPMF